MGLDPGTAYAVVVGVIVGTLVLGVFVWGAASGAFEETEDAKYILFRDEDDDERD
ncbi:MAG: cbb3-type cytochrome oxidase assembly protein CcoS [Capsulimonadaceae bacterium]|nr:cbb3-type cytochrome oxidase assembly protein CcoS [Capsulimonadaceae bacterium]